MGYETANELRELRMQVAQLARETRELAAKLTTGPEGDAIRPELVAKYLVAMADSLTAAARR